MKLEDVRATQAETSYIDVAASSLSQAGQNEEMASESACICLIFLKVNTPPPTLSGFRHIQIELNTLPEQSPAFPYIEAAHTGQLSHSLTLIWSSQSIPAESL